MFSSTTQTFNWIETITNRVSDSYIPSSLRHTNSTPLQRSWCEMRHVGVACARLFGVGRPQPSGLTTGIVKIFFVKARIEGNKHTQVWPVLRPMPACLGVNVSGVGGICCRLKPCACIIFGDNRAPKHGTFQGDSRKQGEGTIFSTHMYVCHERRGDCFGKGPYE